MKSKFFIDEQTGKDIQLTSNSSRSVYDFFNSTKTEGGDRVFKNLFFSPTTDVEEIKERQIKIRRLFPFVDYPFNFDKLIIKDLEKYLGSHPNIPSFLSSLNIFRVSSAEYYYTKRSIVETVDIICHFK